MLAACLAAFWLLAIPIAYWIEGERPSRRSLLGGAVAVAGAVALTLM